VRGACDLLGLDPLAVANEGKIVLFCPVADVAGVLASLRSVPFTGAARVVGEVTKGPAGLAVLRSRIGGQRIIAMPTGEDLPRIS
jgi:hydrogenase expression/formation protein HypE